MNKIVQLFFLAFVPFSPLWSWLVYTYMGKSVNYFLIFILFPLTVYLIIVKRTRVPIYLLFLILFTVYHILISFINHTFSPGSHPVLVVLTDINVLACAFFFIIENSNFDKDFISKMNKCIFLIIIGSLAVSIIQIFNPIFFVSPDLIEATDNSYLSQGRNFSIYSFSDLNTVGISFPIMISILLSIEAMKSKASSSLVISGIVVPFLTRSRYVMLSALVVLSQLFFNTRLNLKKRVILIVIFVGAFFLLISLAKISGFDVQQVISERILENNTDMQSARVRITSLFVFLEKFPENPWFGVGPATRDDVLMLLGGLAPVIHVGYLSYLYYYGLFGCLLFFLSLFYILKKAWKVGKTYMFWGSFYGFVAFCLANTTLVYFNLSEMGIILGMIYLRHFQEQPVPEVSKSGTKFKTGFYPFNKSAHSERRLN